MTTAGFLFLLLFLFLFLINFVLELERALLSAAFGIKLNVVVVGV